MGRKNWGEKIGRNILYGVSGLFLVIGLALVIACIVFSDKLKTIHEQAEVQNDLNQDTVVWVVLFTAVLAVASSVQGIVSALRKWKKSLVQYIAQIFIVFVVQLAMGVLLLTLKAETLKNTFFEDTYNGYIARGKFEDYMKCCGWTYVLQMFSPEQYPCISLKSYTTTCQSATQDFITSWVKPTGIVLLCVSLLSLVALSGALMVIFYTKKAKEDFFENPFSF